MRSWYVRRSQRDFDFQTSFITRDMIGQVEKNIYLAETRCVQDVYRFFHQLHAGRFIFLILAAWCIMNVCQFL